MLGKTWTVAMATGIDCDAKELIDLCKQFNGQQPANADLSPNCPAQLPVDVFS